MTGPTRDTPEGRAYLRLRALSKAQGRATTEFLQLYTLEGFAARLAESQHQHELVLKGGLLMSAFNHRRPTRDIDLLALGLQNDETTMQQVVRAVSLVELADGLQLETESIRSRAIREGDRYAGVRISVRARLATARVSFHVDINVGDPVVPAPGLTELPRLLGGEPIRLLAYPMEMVIAEKLVTAFERGGANTRWRDFADLYLLLSGSPLDESAIEAALRRVADHRGVDLGPFGKVGRDLKGHAEPKWRAWRRKQGLGSRVPEELSETLATIESAMAPLLIRARGK